MRNKQDGTQVKLGAIFSYFLIIANTLSTLFITPMILDVLGSSDYGVYKTVSSLSSSLMVLDLGLGGTLMRYIAKYRADKEENKIAPFLSMAILEAGFLSVLAYAVSIVFYFSIESIYKNSFTIAEIELAKKLFSILAANVVLHIFENVFNGVITGHNNFLFGNGIKIARLALRILLIFVVFFTSRSVVVLVMIDLILTAFMAITELIYILCVYRIKISFTKYKWDRAVFRESFVYTLLLFLTAIVGQIQSNFANIAIGAIRGPQLVTIYSFGLVIFQMILELSSSLSGVMLPTVTNTLRLENGLEKTYDIVVKIGRIQFSILGAVVVGFAVLGKQFIHLWLGEGFDDVYIIVLILMIPSMFELCINTCLAILRAKNMLGFRTAVICGSTLINLIITVIGVKYWSYIAAAIGTATSYALGSVLIMCIYYYKKFGYNMVKLYKLIFTKIWLCILCSGIVTGGVNRVIDGRWGSFFICVIVFAISYAVCLLSFGLTQEEKKAIPIWGHYIAK